MTSNTDKGYDKAVEFDEYAHREYGWVPIFREHRYRAGPIKKTCNVAGFDRIYLDPKRSHPVLAEITTAGKGAHHMRRIKANLAAEVRLALNFKIVLAVYHGGQRRLDRRTKEKVWTKSGTWEIYVVSDPRRADARRKA